MIYYDLILLLLHLYFYFVSIKKSLINNLKPNFCIHLLNFERKKGEKKKHFVRSLK